MKYNCENIFCLLFVDNMVIMYGKLEHAMFTLTNTYFNMGWRSHPQIENNGI